jgi:hypothetical protein
LLAAGVRPAIVISLPRDDPAHARARVALKFLWWALPYIFLMLPIHFSYRNLVLVF